MRLLLTIFLISLLVYSCKKDNTGNKTNDLEEVQLRVFPYFGSEALYLDSVYITDENYLIRFEEIKFYMCNLQYNGNLLVDAALFNYRETQHDFIKVKADYSNFAGINLILGIDSIRNHADPSAFSNSSPLNILNAGNMHWGWNPGYIFVYLDAKVDTIPDGISNLDHTVSFHIGKDEYSRELSFSSIHWVKESENRWGTNMIVDLKKFIYEPDLIDLKKENISHTDIGKEALSLKVMTNFTQSISFE